MLNFFNVFGPRQDPKSQYSGVISKMFDSFEHNKPFTFFGDGLQTRDFVYVYDVVQSVRLIMEHKDAIGHGYNIGTGTFTNLLEVIVLLVNYMENQSSMNLKKHEKEILSILMQIFLT